jgi:hypothetical protein
VTLPRLDRRHPLLPEPLVPRPLRIDRLVGEELGVHAHGHDILVVGAVEDADVAALGQRHDVAP